MTVSVAECQQSLRVTRDPEPFPERVMTDFGLCSNAEIQTKAKRLTVPASGRGWQHTRMVMAPA